MSVYQPGMQGNTVTINGSSSPSPDAIDFSQSKMGTSTYDVVSNSSDDQPGTDAGKFATHTASVEIIPAASDKDTSKFAAYGSSSPSLHSIYFSQTKMGTSAYDVISYSSDDQPGTDAGRFATHTASVEITPAASSDTEPLSGGSSPHVHTEVISDHQSCTDVSKFAAQYYTTMEPQSAESSPQMHTPEVSDIADLPNICVPNSDQAEAHTVKHWTYGEQFKQLYNLSPEPERKEFLDKLFDYMQKKGTPITRIPIMAKQPLDFYKLFKLVVERGGLVEVIKKKAWRNVAKELNLPPSITSAAFTMRSQYVKFLYPYECAIEKLSDPQELQMAIDSNKRDRRHSETVEFISPQIAGCRPGELDATSVTGHVTVAQGLQLISSPTVAIPHGSLPPYSGGFIVTSGGGQHQLLQMPPGIPIMMPAPSKEPSETGSIDESQDSTETPETPRKMFGSPQILRMAPHHLQMLPVTSSSTTKTDSPTLEFIQTKRPMPPVAIPHGSLPPYSGGFIVTPGGGQHQLLQMPPGIPFMMPAPSKESSETGSIDESQDYAETSEPPRKKFGLDLGPAKVTVSSRPLTTMPSHSPGFLLAPGSTSHNMFGSPQILQMAPHHPIPLQMRPTATSSADQSDYSTLQTKRPMPPVTIPHGSLPPYSGGFIVTSGDGQHQLLQMPPGIPIMMPAPSKEPSETGSIDESQDYAETFEPPRKMFGSPQILQMAPHHLQMLPVTSSSTTKTDCPTLEFIQTKRPTPSVTVGNGVPIATIPPQTVGSMMMPRGAHLASPRLVQMANPQPLMVPGTGQARKPRAEPGEQADTSRSSDHMPSSLNTKVSFANISIQSASTKDSNETDSSLLVTLELNSVVYQGVLFAKPSSVAQSSSPSTTR